MVTFVSKFQPDSTDFVFPEVRGITTALDAYKRSHEVPESLLEEAHFREVCRMGKLRGTPGGGIEACRRGAD